MLCKEYTVNHETYRNFLSHKEQSKGIFQLVEALKNFTFYFARNWLVNGSYLLELLLSQLYWLHYILWVRGFLKLCYKYLYTVSVLKCESEGNILCLLHITKRTYKNNEFLYFKIEMPGENIYDDAISENIQIFFRYLKYFIRYGTMALSSN